MSQARHIEPDTLNALIDETLPAAERAALLRHLGTCPDCRREWQELRAVAQLYAGLPQFRPPRPFTLGPEYGRPAAAPRVIQFLPVLRSISIAAALVFVLLSAFAVINTRQSSASPSDQGAPAAQNRAMLGAPASNSAEAPAATQPASNQAQSAAPAGASEGARAAQPATTATAKRVAAHRDESLSGWWIASFVTGLGMALLLLAWFAVDRGRVRRPSLA